MICINCGHEHEYKFCPNCGEKATVPRISFVTMLGEGIATLINMDKGFLFNVKNLLLQPNKMVNDYLKGKRKGIFNPISFLVIAITIYLIVDALVVIEIDVRSANSEVYRMGVEAGRFIKLYFKYFWILSIFWLSLSTKLFFGQYNYAEHLTINAFVIGQASLMSVIGFLLLKIDLFFNPITYATIIWLLYKIFENKKRKLDIFLQAFGTTLIFFILSFIILGIIGYLKS